MPTKKTESPGWTPPDESEVKQPAPLEFAPPGCVEWNADEAARPAEWRPSDDPHSPTRVGAGEEWQPPERGTDPEPDSDKPRE
jgi:hypothetical protein